ncbi:MAG: MerR family transcriptional regulator [Candidatus Latescibacteria bacterium]|jgi:DNA-binding transcriptional MerR regulator|nr:MerR family transcriptional regulator [Candidatus Latescibacterota bacterium]
MEKVYYSIREVSELTGVEPHVLRFWEKEFPMLRPRRGRSGNRSYKERDIKIVLAIRDLRLNEKYTIKGAVERLKEDRSLWEDRSLEAEQEARPEPVPSEDLVKELRTMLTDLRDLVKGGN